MKQRQAIGLDFGTTNSAIAVAQRGKGAILTGFQDGDHVTTSFRSILYFPEAERGTPRTKQTTAIAGPAAINEYLRADSKGRLILSIKSYLASHLFTSTSIYGRSYGLEDLVAIIIRNLRDACVGQFNLPGTKAVLGRPVHFAGSEGADGEALALQRLRKAAELAGFEEVIFELEPIAAAYQYESQLDHDELVLVGDFGGGTSDFTLMQLGPFRKQSATPIGVLGTEGVAIAGDVFDSTIIKHVVAPQLGMGSHYVSLGKEFNVPAWIYTQLSSWHQMSFLRSGNSMSVLKDVTVQALEPEKLESLIYIIIHNLGYDLYRSVERAKLDLTSRDSTQFVFDRGPVDIEQSVQRGQFEDWIKPYIQKIADAVTRLLNSCSLKASDVDSVFLTGGSSLVPAVRRLFAEKFGEKRLRSGDELTTVAKGLALVALEKL